MMFYAEFWFVLSVMCFLGELLAGGLFLLWFGISALVVAHCSLYGFDPVVQSIIFILLSLGLLVLIRPFTLKIFPNSPKKSAVDRLMGKKGVVIDDLFLQEDGDVKMDGDLKNDRPSESTKNNPVVNINNLNSVKIDVEYKGDRKL